MRIKQGDAYDVFITLTDDEGGIVSMTYGEAEIVEIMLGRLRKTCPGEITENEVRGWEGLASGEVKSFFIGDEAYDDTFIINGDGITDMIREGDTITIDFSDPSVDPHMERAKVKVTAVGDGFIVPDGYMSPFEGVTSFDQEVSITVEHTGGFVMPLTQEETFAMSGTLPLEARVKFTDGTVVGTSLGVVVVDESQSKEVL